jgi:hypothetical protein
MCLYAYTHGSAHTHRHSFSKYCIFVYATRERYVLVTDTVKTGSSMVSGLHRRLFSFAKKIVCSFFILTLVVLWSIAT